MNVFFSEKSETNCKAKINVPCKSFILFFCIFRESIMRHLHGKYCVASYFKAKFHRIRLHHLINES